MRTTISDGVNNVTIDGPYYGYQTNVRVCRVEWLGPSGHASIQEVPVDTLLRLADAIYRTAGEQPPIAVTVPKQQTSEEVTTDSGNAEDEVARIKQRMLEGQR